MGFKKVPWWIPKIQGRGSRSFELFSKQKEIFLRDGFPYNVQNFYLPCLGYLVQPGPGPAPSPFPPRKVCLFVPYLSMRQDMLIKIKSPFFYFIYCIILFVSSGLILSLYQINGAVP